MERTEKRLKDDSMTAHEHLPKPNNMPSSFTEALSLVKPYLYHQKFTYPLKTAHSSESLCKKHIERIMHYGNNALWE